jgi:hypothetical protein
MRIAAAKEMSRMTIGECPSNPEMMPQIPGLRAAAAAARP